MVRAGSVPLLPVPECLRQTLHSYHAGSPHGPNRARRSLPEIGLFTMVKVYIVIFYYSKLHRSRRLIVDAFALIAALELPLQVIPVRPKYQ